MKPTRTGVEIRRMLDASAERVFAAFAEPELVAKWLRPSPDVKLTVLRFEFRAGGAYRFLYEVPGGREMRVGGTFRSIQPPLQIVFSWLIEPPDEHAGIDSLVSVQLVPNAASTELIIRHDGFGRLDAEQRHDQGWRGALDLLRKQLTLEVIHGD